MVRDEPQAFETFIEQAQGRTPSELAEAALVLSASADVQVNQLLGNLLLYCGPAALEPLARRVVEAFEQKVPDVDEWERALLVPMQDEEIRAALPYRERFLAAVPEDSWLYGLLMVVDDQPCVVLHRPSGTGFEVTIGGIGDNFQLHTLLAYRLVPEHVPGEPPLPEWVAAASVGPELEPAGGIRGQFQLVDAFGETIWNEGRPADIPVVDGRRVIVLDPPPYARSWNVGRVYPEMAPQVDVTRVLSAAEAAEWLAKVE